MVALPLFYFLSVLAPGDRIYETKQNEILCLETDSEILSPGQIFYTGFAENLPFVSLSHNLTYKSPDTKTQKKNLQVRLNQPDIPPITEYQKHIQFFAPGSSYTIHSFYSFHAFW